jgi:hypothetical protein
MYGSVVRRQGKADHLTTCPQAEALYPVELPLDHLQAITVGDEAEYEAVFARLRHFPPNPKIEQDPEAFR